MRVAVTGATGLIGSHSVHALLGAGADVLAVMRAGPDPSTIPAAAAAPAEAALGAEHAVIDLLAPQAGAALARLAPDAIVHAAAVLPRGGGDAASAREAAQANRRIDDQVVEAARRVGCRVIYLSSISVYGFPADACDERSPVRPRSVYAEAKLASEAAFAALDAPAVSLRVSSPYGTPQRMTTVLRRFVDLALRGEPLRYYGTGSREQDFIAARDVGTAVAAAVLRPAARGVVNVAGGRAIAMRDLAALVIATLGSASALAAAGVDDPEEDFRARYRIAHAASLLQWQPATSLEAGIRALAGRASL